MNEVYREFVHALGLGEINFTMGTWKVALINTGAYTKNTNHGGHKYLSSVPGGAILSSATCTLTYTAGVVSIANFNLSFPDPGGGAQGQVLLVYRDTGTAATSHLFLHLANVDGLPVTLDGVADTIEFPANMFDLNP